MQPGGNLSEVLERFEAMPMLGRRTIARRSSASGGSAAVDLDPLTARKDGAAFWMALRVKTDGREGGGVERANGPATGPKTVQTCPNPIIRTHDS